MTVMARVVRMDTKRRPTLPAELLEAAGIAIGDELIASTEGDGALVLRSRTGSLRHIQDEIASGFSTKAVSRTAPSLREDRDADDLALDRRMSRQSDDADAAGAALLSRLGL